MTDSPSSGPTTPSAPDSPALAAAKERYELRKLDLDRRRLALDDQVARADSRAKVAKGSVDAVKSYLPSSLEIPVEKDTLTTQGDPTGLAPTFAGRAALQSIDDIADQVVAVTNPMLHPEVLVVADSSFVIDQQRADEIDVRLGLVERQLTDANVPAGGEGDDHLSATVKALQDRNGSGEAHLMGPVIGALSSLLPSAVTSLTRVFAHQYTASGTAIASPDLGVDLRLAGALREKMSADPSVTILVNRMWVPPGSPLLDRLLGVADRLLKLKGHARDAEIDRDEAAAAVARKNEAVLAERDARKALIEKAPTTADSTQSSWQRAWDGVNGQLEQLADELVELEEQLATKESAADRLAELVTQVETFLTSVLTADGVAAPVFSAMRGEWLRNKEHGVIVYVRVLSAGVDQVLDVKLGPDKRCVLSGASIEYAAVGHSGELLFSGVYDGLWTASMKLTEPDTFEGKQVGYMPVANLRRPPPAAD